MPQIAENSVFDLQTIGTLDNFVSVPKGAAGITYVNVDSAAAYKPEVRLDGKYGSVNVSKSKSLAVITIPIINPETGSVRYNTLRIEMKVHPEDADACIKRLKSLGMNILHNDVFHQFWNYGRYLITP